MSSPFILADAPAIRALLSEQRLQQRYPLPLDLRYTLWDEDDITDSRSGKTLNLSSGGVLFLAEELVPKHGRIELAID